MDLFSLGEDTGSGRLLADRMRPANLDEYIGQEHIVGQGSCCAELLRQIRSPLFCFTALQAAEKQHWPILFPIIHRGNSSA